MLQVKGDAWFGGPESRLAAPCPLPTQALCVSQDQSWRVLRERLFTQGHLATGLDLGGGDLRNGAQCSCL